MIDLTAKPFWIAASFWRRAPAEERMKAVHVLANIATDPNHLAQSRAETILKEMKHVTVKPGRTYEG